MERQAITVRGVVQGVGFRPFVYSLASRLQLVGFVQNKSGSVLIEVQGDRRTIDQFVEELRTQAPPLSQIDEISRQSLPVIGEQQFRIESSDVDLSGPIFIAADMAVCVDCLAELFDPVDRRYRYPFLNCTNCGPRLTIIQSVPYDRQRTTMAEFAMCQACRAEYDEPGNRRFHAQPTACPECGPQLSVVDENGEPMTSNNPLTVFIEQLLAGKIAAMKGMGGYHLVCDARDESVVAELRRRKHRDEKPFAILVRNVETARSLCVFDSHEEELLTSQRRPIVLLRKRRFQSTVSPTITEGVAPGNPYLGVMLPCTPVQHLLMDAVGNIPLVMTSGNRSDEPIVHRDDEVVDRLSQIADLFLQDNRPIHVRCDDSVTRIVDDAELLVRRSRGYAPRPIKLPLECPGPILAVGGQLKGVFALGRGRQAFLSHHMGDLDQFDAYRAFERDILLYQQLFDIRPNIIAHDLHPEYASTGYAQRRAMEGIELFPVQHHHAHMASCMAEHGLDEMVIGVTFDGTGFGTDATIWGGEFLVGDYTQFVRAGHLRCVRLPGGDKAIREPWRIALSHLLDAGLNEPSVSGVSASQQRTIKQMIDRGFNSPVTSSAGRLFDAVAAIAGVRSHVSFEGQAAIQLEWLATDVADKGIYPFELQPESASGCQKMDLSPFSIDTRPLIRAIAEDSQKSTPIEVIARRFHSTIVEMIVAACDRIRSQTGLKAVVLSGGVFLNALLLREVCAQLAAAGFRAYRHRLVPPGDGGLSLGQLAIAARTVLDKSSAMKFDSQAAQTELTA